MASPPFLYVGSSAQAVWELTRNAGDNALAEEIFELDPLDRPPYGLITTQTCDINEAKPKHPWIHLVPVEPLEDGNLAGLVKRHRVSYLVPLSPPTLEGLWVADLRLEVPVEKSWLVGRLPVESYGTEADYETLAQRLAAKRERPALAESLIAGLSRPLTTWLEKKAGRDASAIVDEIRLQIIGGTRLVPTAASLVLIKDAPWSAAEIAPWDKWWDEARTVAAGHGIDLLANEYTTFSTMSAGAYLGSVPMNFGYLSD